MRRPLGCVQPYPNPLVADRAVDLLRVNSALCTAPGRARCRGWPSFPAPASWRKPRSRRAVVRPAPGARASRTAPV